MFDLSGLLGLLDDLSLAHLFVGGGDRLEVRGLHGLTALRWKFGHYEYVTKQFVKLEVSSKEEDLRWSSKYLMILFLGGHQGCFIDPA